MSHILLYLILISIFLMCLAEAKKQPSVENKPVYSVAKPLYSDINKAYTVYNSNYSAYDIMSEEEILSSNLAHHEIQRMTEGEMLYKDYQDFQNTVPKNHLKSIKKGF